MFFVRGIGVYHSYHSKVEVEAGKFWEGGGGIRGKVILEGGWRGMGYLG